jgi:DNA-binding NarL/FixJ family response regulator
MSDPIRVLIADDHRVYREGVRALLDGEATIKIVGEAASGEEAVERAARLAPDVVLMDLKMPGLNGIEATRAILARAPDTAILVVTMFDDDDSVFAVLRAGARGYLLKDADQEELLRAIRAVRGGEAIFGPAIARRMAQYFATRPAPADPPATPFPELTERERAVLDLIARGQNNAAIANRLSLSVKTVQNYVSTIFAKLQVEDRAQALLRARDAGLGG